MKSTAFDPSGPMIIVKAHVWGPLADVELDLVLDTGSTQTLLLPHIMDELGFNPRDGIVITGVYSAVGKEQGYLIKVPRFSVLGFTRTRLSNPRLRPRGSLQHSWSRRLHGEISRRTDPGRGNSGRDPGWVADACKRLQAARWSRASPSRGPASPRCSPRSCPAAGGLLSCCSQEAARFARHWTSLRTCRTTPGLGVAGALARACRSSAWPA